MQETPVIYLDISPKSPFNGTALSIQSPSTQADSIFEAPLGLATTRLEYIHDEGFLFPQEQDYQRRSNSIFPVKDILCTPACQSPVRDPTEDTMRMSSGGL